MNNPSALQHKLSSGDIAPPWDQQRPPLYEFMRGGVTGNEQMPDHAVYKPVIWVNPAFLPALAKDDHETEAQRIFFCLKNFLNKQDSATIRQLYDMLAICHPDNYIDDLSALFVRDESIASDDIYDLTQWLMTRAPDRLAVMAGIALSGLVSVVVDEDAALPGDVHVAAHIVMTLGRHEEFAFYAAQVLTLSHMNGAYLAWQMAQRNTGHARFNAAAALKGVEIPLIQEWLKDYDHSEEW